ncbi:MAG: mechanosensitive ion channel family protein [Alphaproteobacteria bacterium]|nr:mechanosensitive ion channel family protein [Alphaproteobacteria bacterium]MCB9974995.1 mechanosensitive ion channel family protein [Rhodospirillales bacterium]
MALENLEQANTEPVAETPEQIIEQAGNFWNEVVDVWQHGLMGINVGQIIVALSIFGVFLVFRGLLTKYILHAIKRWTDKTKTDLDDKIIEAVMPPLRFIPIILGTFFATQVLNLDGILAVFTYRLIRTMIAFTIFWALHRALDPIAHMSKKLKKTLTPTMVTWMFKFLKIVVAFIGAAVILEIWGIAIGPLLAGLGLFGAAVALGAQDLFKNLIGGLTIIAEKRFSPGDWIKVDGVVEGTVEDIGFRSTRVRRFDKAPVHVPNSALSDAVITNFSRMTHRRIYWKIGVTYSTTKEQLKLIGEEILNYIMTNDDFAKPPEVSTFVRLDSFNDSSIDFMIYCFTKTKDWGEWLQIKEDFALAIKDIVENKAGTGFAFPSQSIYLETLPGNDNAAELFIPPQKKSEKKAVKKAS